MFICATNAGSGKLKKKKENNFTFLFIQVFVISIINDGNNNYTSHCIICVYRYNKSGGCVCRNCRWVLCKEEKRKALQHITYMRRTRANGRVDPDDDIVDFICSPKYWSCGQAWKVGWIPQDNNDNNNEFDEEADVSMEEEEGDDEVEDQLQQQK